jgi:hypothetical protein
MANCCTDLINLEHQQDVPGDAEMSLDPTANRVVHQLKEEVLNTVIIPIIPKSIQIKSQV